MTQTSDDLALQAIYGKAYGPAHKDKLQDEESARRAVDLSRQPEIYDASVQAGFTPARSVFGASTDEMLGLRPGVAGLLPADIDWEDAVDTQPMVIDDLLSEDCESAIDRDIRAWLADNQNAMPTTQELLTNALHYVQDCITRSDEMELAEAMQRLGYEKTQRRIAGSRVWVWVRGADEPSQTPDSTSQT
ncbi:hypothetical protein UB44_23350 [Burkholderiaceae bacterium 26]|nr:hypothetical protein UB44_23350 [Burkholderiaceae bacterium 26]